MKFDVFLILRGPARTIKAPNTKNPVEHESLGSLLEELSHNLPSPMGCECVGVEVAPHGVEIEVLS